MKLSFPLCIDFAWMDDTDQDITGYLDSTFPSVNNVSNKLKYAKTLQLYLREFPSLSLLSSHCI